MSKSVVSRVARNDPEGFFSDGLIDLIKSAGLSVQADLQFTFVPSKEWFAAFEDPKTKEKFDFILSSYAASERYPAVQLRYITHPLVKPPIDLKLAESPTITADNSEILRDYEKWLLRSQVAIPLFFNVTQFIFRESLDLGNQSLTDAEIELWRIQESSR